MAWSDQPELQASGWNEFNKEQFEKGGPTKEGWHVGPFGVPYYGKSPDDTATKAPEVKPDASQDRADKFVDDLRDQKKQEAALAAKKKADLAADTEARKKRLEAAEQMAKTTMGTQTPKLGALRKPASDLAEESKSTADLSAFAAKAPAVKAARQPTVEPANFPKQAKTRGKLRRAASAMGRGLKATGRGVKTAFAGSPRKTTVVAKNTLYKAPYGGQKV